MRCGAVSIKALRQQYIFKHEADDHEPEKQRTRP
jgi:hypothetical protein